MEEETKYDEAELTSLMAVTLLMLVVKQNNGRARKCKGDCEDDFFIVFLDTPAGWVPMCVENKYWDSMDCEAGLIPDGQSAGFADILGLAQG